VVYAQASASAGAIGPNCSRQRSGDSPAAAARMAPCILVTIASGTS
jgi:hypothetical protein